MLVAKEGGELKNSLRGGKGGALAKFGGGPSKLIRGALSCYSGLVGGVSAGDSRGGAIGGTKRPIVNDPIFEVY